MTEKAEPVNVNAFLDYLRENEPAIAANYVERPSPVLEPPNGPLAASIDGWWYVTQIEGAIRAATADLIEELDGYRNGDDRWGKK